MHFGQSALLALLIGLSGVFSAPSAFGLDQESCQSLTALDFGSVPDAPAALTSVEWHSEPVDHCRVSGSVAAAVGFEMRLPGNAWNGKLLMQGCRAYCGVIMVDQADDALLRGYATVATDMGHTGTILDTVWAYNNRKAEIDYGFRATHVTAVIAKAIIDAGYGGSPDRSYFRGCSTGGR